MSVCKIWLLAQLLIHHITMLYSHCPEIWATDADFPWSGGDTCQQKRSWGLRKGDWHWLGCIGEGFDTTLSQYLPLVTWLTLPSKAKLKGIELVEWSSCRGISCFLKITQLAPFYSISQLWPCILRPPITVPSLNFLAAHG